MCLTKADTAGSDINPEMSSCIPQVSQKFWIGRCCHAFLNTHIGIGSRGRARHRKRSLDVLSEQKKANKEKTADLAVGVSNVVTVSTLS